MKFPSKLLFLIVIANSLSKSQDILECVGQFRAILDRNVFHQRDAQRLLDLQNCIPDELLNQPIYDGFTPLSYLANSANHFLANSADFLINMITRGASIFAGAPGKSALEILVKDVSTHSRHENFVKNLIVALRFGLNARNREAILSFLKSTNFDFSRANSEIVKVFIGVLIEQNLLDEELIYSLIRANVENKDFSLYLLSKLKQYEEPAGPAPVQRPEGPMTQVQRIIQDCLAR